MQHNASQPASAKAEPSPIASPRHRFSGWRGKLALSLFGCLLALGLVEIGARLSGRFTPPPYPPQCDRPELYEAYPPFGYRLHPSQTMEYSYPRRNPRRLTVVSNALGFRDHQDTSAPSTGPRLFVLGDSFVFGEGVEADERFTDQLAARRPEWRVINLGMTGFGLDNMLRVFEHVVRPTPADGILVCVYTDDLRRVRPHYAGAGFELERYRLQGDELISVEYPPRHFWDGLHTAELVRRVHWRLTDMEHRLNGAIFARICQLTDHAGARLALVFLPAEQDLPNDRSRRTWLQSLAAEHGRPFLDLTEPIQQRRREVFIPGNPHYNPLGHQVVAEQLESFVAEQLLPASPPKP